MEWKVIGAIAFVALAWKMYDIHLEMQVKTRWKHIRLHHRDQTSECEFCRLHRFCWWPMPRPDSLAMLPSDPAMSKTEYAPPGVFSKRRELQRLRYLMVIHHMRLFEKRMEGLREFMQGRLTPKDPEEDCLLCEDEYKRTKELWFWPT